MLLKIKKNNEQTQNLLASMNFRLIYLSVLHLCCSSSINLIALSAQMLKQNQQKSELHLYDSRRTSMI